MNYEKMWRTLKAESGYRECSDSLGLTKIPLSKLMSDMETRAKEEQRKQEAKWNDLLKHYNALKL